MTIIEVTDTTAMIKDLSIVIETIGIAIVLEVLTRTQKAPGVPMEITFMDNGGKHNLYYVNS